MALLPSWFTVLLGFAPLPYPFLQALREIEVECSIGRASIFRLHFELSRTITGDFDALTFDIFRPLFPISVAFSHGIPVPQILVNGYIKDVQLSMGNTPGSARLEVVALDVLGTKMANVQQPFPWPNAPDSNIASAIFAKHLVIPLVDPIPPTRTLLDTVTNQAHYDAPFLMRLAEFYGYDLFVQPDPFTGRDIGHMHRPMTTFPPQGVLSIDFGSQSNLTDFNMSNDMLKPATVMGTSIEQNTRAPIPAIAPVSTDIPMGLEPSLYRILPPAIAIDPLMEAANPSEAQVRAAAKVTQGSRNITARGTVDGVKFGRPLRVGLPVLVRGPGLQHNGRYYVDSVTHKISRDNYQQSFTAWRNAVGWLPTDVFIDPLAAVA